MRQTVKVCVAFPNFTDEIVIRDVYQKDDTLIALIETLPSSIEAITEGCPSSDFLVVETNADYELPVETIVIPQNCEYPLNNISAINGLQPLPRITDSIFSQGLFAKNKSDQEREQMVPSTWKKWSQ